MAGSGESPGHGARDVREQILLTAYDLFGRDSIRGVGIDKIIATAQVAKATFYRHFASKNDLVLAVLDHHAQRWARSMIVRAEAQAASPEERLLAAFDSLDEFIRREESQSFTLIKVLLEAGPHEGIGVAAADHLRTVRAWGRDAAQEAGLRDPEGLGHIWHIILKGSVVAAVEGDTEAARRGRSLVALMIDAHR